MVIMMIKVIPPYRKALMEVHQEVHQAVVQQKVGRWLTLHANSAGIDRYQAVRHYLKVRTVPGLRWLYITTLAYHFHVHRMHRPAMDGKSVIQRHSRVTLFITAVM